MGSKWCGMMIGIIRPRWESDESISTCYSISNYLPWSSALQRDKMKRISRIPEAAPKNSSRPPNTVSFTLGSTTAGKPNAGEPPLSTSNHGNSSISSKTTINSPTAGSETGFPAKLPRRGGEHLRGSSCWDRRHRCFSKVRNTGPRNPGFISRIIMRGLRRLCKKEGWLSWRSLRTLRYPGRSRNYPYHMTLKHLRGASWTIASAREICGVE